MGGGWINPLQTLPQGLVLMFDIDPDPELDKIIIGERLGTDSRQTLTHPNICTYRAATLQMKTVEKLLIDC